jgi:hypothetical protein
VARGDTAAAEDGAEDAADAESDAEEAGETADEVAEEAAEAAGGADDPPDEHPAAAAATATADAAPPSLSHNEAEPNITNHLLLMTGMSANTRTRERTRERARTRPQNAASRPPLHHLRRRPVSYGWREITSLRERGIRVI